MLPISVSVYIYLNFLCRHSVYICIGKIFFYNYVSLYVFVIFYHFVFLFLFICFPLCNQLSHRYWKKYSDSCNGCKVKKALIKVVKQYLTPPPTSTNVERLFSYAGMVMEDRRALLMPERVNKILFLRENLVMLNFKLDWWSKNQF